MLMPLHCQAIDLVVLDRQIVGVEADDAAAGGIMGDRVGDRYVVVPWLDDERAAQVAGRRRVDP
jgi:hypothetical protein